MKSITIVSVLALATFACVSASTDLELGLGFLECFRKAIDGGIPEDDIPSYSPLKINKEFDFYLPLGVTLINFAFKDITLEKIPTWEVIWADDISTDSEVATFNFTLRWPEIVYRQKLVSTMLDPNTLELNIPVGQTDIVVTSKDVEINGIWSQKKPWTSIKELEELSIRLSVKEVDFKSAGLGEEFEFLASSYLPSIVNTIGATDLIGNFLKEKIRTEWIEKPERIVAVAENCGVSKA